MLKSTKILSKVANKSVFWKTNCKSELANSIDNFDTVICV